jgi:hypothetical protein
METLHTTGTELTHVNVADRDFAGVSEGWFKYYWIPQNKDNHAF